MSKDKCIEPFSMEGGVHMHKPRSIKSWMTESGVELARTESWPQQNVLWCSLNNEKKLNEKWASEETVINSFI